MVIAGRVNRVAFYCRMNHRDHDYTQFLDDVKKRLERAYGKQEWELKIYFEEASGADPDRKEFNRLKQDISQDQIDVGSGFCPGSDDCQGLGTVYGVYGNL